MQKNQKKLMSQFWEKLFTKGQTHERTNYMTYPVKPLGLIKKKASYRHLGYR